MRQSLGFRFAIEGDLRFISHHDTVRLFERALARAELPIRRSEGFNPRPKLSLPLPRSVGIAATADLLIVELAASIAAEEALSRLSAQMPEGIRLLSVRIYPDSGPREALSVTYSLPLGGDEQTVRDRVESFLNRDSHIVQRRDNLTGRIRPMDVRSGVKSVSIESGRLVWTQALGSGGVARPGEVLEALGLDPRETLHRVVRGHVEFREA